ncbi:hypothetical protein CAPN006_21410 [Capnocytophaga canimorsus]|nr:hypothetical protein CAPN006_21410 [Capnocytophaga canimorsus]
MGGAGGGFIPFRQLGQYEDVETGLYYNRFRYYSPETGLYISKDPIGLLGGFALYGYVKDTNSFVDIFGLELITVFRFDTRSPQEIKSIGGFHAKQPDANIDIYHYASNNPPSQYISTSHDVDSAVDFGNRYYGGKGYVYKIEIDDSKGVNVNQILGIDSPFPEEKEFAVIKHISNEDIKGHTKNVKNSKNIKWSCY